MTETRPLLGATRSAITRSKVDLPQPDGPSSVRKLPRAMTRSMLSSAVTVPRSLVKRTLTPSQETAVSANGRFAYRIAGDPGVPHDARLGHVERRRLVQQAAVVPDHHVARPPVVMVEARRLAGEVDQLLQELLRFLRRKARDVVRVAADQQRLAAGVGMALDQRPQHVPVALEAQPAIVVG